MQTIHIKNLEEYQPKYKDGRRLIWIRWDIDSLGDLKITKLNPVQKWLFIGLICLEVKEQQAIPLDEKWLSERLGIEKKHIYKHLLMLQTLELIVISRNEMSPTEQTDITDRTDITKHNNTPHFDFDSLWLKYPSKVGKKEAERHFHASVKLEQDWIDIQTSLTNYLNSDRVKKNFIQDGDRWFKGWRDWISATPKPVDPNAQYKR